MDLDLARKTTPEEEMRLKWDLKAPKKFTPAEIAEWAKGRKTLNLIRSPKHRLRLLKGQVYKHPEFQKKVVVTKTGEMAKIRSGGDRLTVKAAVFLKEAKLVSAPESVNAERHWVLLKMSLGRLQKLRKMFPGTLLGRIKTSGIPKYVYYQLADSEYYKLSGYILSEKVADLVPKSPTEILKHWKANTTRLFKLRITQEG